MIANAKGKGRTMKTHVGSVVLVFIGLLGLLGLTAGCSVLPEVQPDLTRYYVLTPVAPAAEAAPAPERPRRISLRVTDMPAFLRGQLMKVRVADNEVRFVDEARWAEPLESGLARVMRKNFDLRATAVRVVSRADEDRDFAVVLAFQDCEGVVQTGAARLAARVNVYTSGADAKLRAEEEFSIDIPGWDGRDYCALAAKLSEAAGALSDRVATLLSEAEK
jgi:uncharacterized lipoprotein YmbA